MGARTDKRAREPLEAAFGHRFNDPSLLDLALTHRSAMFAGGRSNERLEFLGDRVLGLVVADMLCRRFPEEDEGALARRFAVLVGRDALSRVATDLDLGTYLILSSGEEDSGGRDNPALLANACEAAIAALYRDGGLAPAARFIEARWTPLLAADLEPPKDPKTALQEWVQARGLPLPEYREIDRTGPPHAPVFTIEVSIPGHQSAQAAGASKRIAERNAAADMLVRVLAMGGDLR